MFLSNAQHVVGLRANGASASVRLSPGHARCDNRGHAIKVPYPDLPVLLGRRHASFTSQLTGEYDRYNYNYGGRRGRREVARMQTDDPSCRVSSSARTARQAVMVFTS